LPSAADARTADSPPSNVSTARLATTADVSTAVVKPASRADFIVVAQPGPQDNDATRQAFRSALRDTERPVLMVPKDWSVVSFGQRIAIAWHDDIWTTQAMISALPLFAGAAEVHLLAGVRPEAPNPLHPDRFGNCEASVKVHILNLDYVPFGGLLLSRAQELKADLLIMASYVHSPFSHSVLAGATRYVITHAALPVLMRTSYMLSAPSH
jgi:hypothetical protein